ncbi:aldehyde dehydrogenase [Paraburkholderia nemoris]|uniref:aldehyde dehydrogenase n=1 Tax=Paraburkholderia nemoris TaxID=2793076 RepID=UPI001B18D116|nr:aldehyde dehydrogenase [Paraburkholderia nemoris]CAE6858536.1 Vanillin dehydrogenase [Paraburkholderia nemoris]
MATINLFINGADAAAASGKTFTRSNPVSGDVVSTAAAAGPADATRAIEAAQAAFPAWSATPPAARRALMLRAAERLLESSESIVAMMVKETGAAKSWASFNVKLGCDLLREAGAMTTQLTGDVIPTEKAGCLSIASREPWGVCLGIAPWNAPIVLFVRAFAMAVACGNTVVLKSSELCPGTHYLITKAVTEGTFPPGVVNLVSHAAEDAPEVVQCLVAHPAVRHINFTGSSHVGSIIARQAGELLKPVLLELGGKSPIVVLGDANIDDAVDAAIFGSFMHQGQICMATGRVIVVDEIADTFVERFARRAASLEAGDPNAGAALGAMISEASVARVNALIDDAVAKGAERKSGGVARGAIMNATVLDRVTPEMDIYRAEVFGPVAPVIRVRDDEEAIRVANDTEYGLSAAVFSQNINRALTVSRRIESGICHINGPTIQDEAQIPFGGVKASGHGRFGGRGGVEAFTYSRWITVETQKPHYPF